MKAAEGDQSIDLEIENYPELSRWVQCFTSVLGEEEGGTGAGT